MSSLNLNPIEKYLEAFTKLENEIRANFNSIVSSVTERRELLLTELKERKNDFEKQMDSRLKTIKQLEGMKEKLDTLDVENDQASHRLKSQLIAITEELEELRRKISIPNIELKCDISPVIEVIEGLGEIKIEESGEDTIYYEIMEGRQDEKAVNMRPKPPTLPPKPQKAPGFKPKNSYDELPSCESWQGGSYEILTKVLENPPELQSHQSQEASPYETPTQTAFSYFPKKNSFEEFTDQTTVMSVYSEIPTDPNSLKTGNASPKKTSSSLTFEGKKKPTLTFCKRGSEKGQTMQPRGICFAPITQYVYVVSRDQHEILVFSLKGKFIAEFGKGHLEGPSGVTVHYGKCYVTDEKANGIFTFRTSDYEVESSHIFKRGHQYGKIKSLKTIAIDSNNEIFLVDTGNDQVCILNYDMTMNRVLGFGVLQKPQDVNVSLENTVYVLDLQASSCVHLFTKMGEHLNSIISTETLGQDASSIPNYFCVSKEGLIILSVLYESTLKVYTSKGKMVQEIGKKQTGKDKSSNSQGVCLANDSKIVCAFAEGNFCINVY